jgi:hypothetical protein
MEGMSTRVAFENKLENLMFSIRELDEPGQEQAYLMASQLIDAAFGLIASGSYTFAPTTKTKAAGTQTLCPRCGKPVTVSAITLTR